MKITFFEFLGLTVQEKYDAIFITGDFLEIRIQENRCFVLYALDLFFVEVEYDNEKNKIMNNRAFVSGKILDKYSSLVLY